MMSQTFRGVMKGRTLVVLDQAAPLPDGTPVAVTPLPDEAGSPAALLAAMAAPPQLSAEDVAELDQAIAQGQRPGKPPPPCSKRRAPPCLPAAHQRQ